MKAHHYQTKIIDGIPKKIYKIIAHRFNISDCEDPDLYAAEPIYKWQQSEQGQYIMSKALEIPQWTRNTCFDVYGYEYLIVANLYEEDVTYFTLRWT